MLPVRSLRAACARLGVARLERCLCEAWSARPHRDVAPQLSHALLCERASHGVKLAAVLVLLIAVFVVKHEHFITISLSIGMLSIVNLVLYLKWWLQC